MKPKIIRYFLCVAVFLLALASAFYFSPPARDLRRVRHHMSELGSASDIRDIAAGCLTLLQSSPSSQILDPAPTDERLPAAIRSKHPRWLSIDPTSRTVLIEFGGGFFHYGYRFEPVDGEHWRLLLYGEEPDDVRELLRL